MTFGKPSLPPIVPLFPLAQAIVMPRMPLPLNIFEMRYMRMTDDALRTARVIGMVQPRDSAQRPALHEVGCLGRITAWQETDDNRYLITLTGVTRFRIAQEVAADTPYRQAMADYAPFAGDLAEPPSEVDFDRSRLLAALGAFLKSRNLDADWEAAETAPPEALIHQLCMHCPLEPAEKQALLEAPSLASRAQTLTALLEMSAAGGSGRILQ